MNPTCIFCDKPIIETAVSMLMHGNSCVCRSCRSDTELGRAVRRLSRDAYDLFHCERLWGVSHRERGTVGSGKTPEDALKAAGLMEGEQMKNIKIELNANEASGEAYWRKRCDTVEAEIERIKRNHGCAREQGSTQYCREALDAHKEADRLRAALSRADVALSEAPFHGQEELAEVSLADGIRNYRNAVEAELASLRAGNAELTKQIEVQKKTLEIVLEEAEEWGRFVEVDNAPMQIRPYLERAISRAEQAGKAKPEVETCVWVRNPYKHIWVTGCGYQRVYPDSPDGGACVVCGKKVEVKG